jgi:hypothetical protein
MSDDYEVPDDCGCEEDINHFLYNLNYFASRCHTHLTAIQLNKNEIMGMFKYWMQSVTQEDEHNPFMSFAEDFINKSGSFSVEDFTFDEEDEDDDA